MRILLTGVTGYIGKRLLPELLKDGHQVFCCVRDRRRFQPSAETGNQLTIIEADFLREDSLNEIPADIDVAYYLIHSMSASIGEFAALEEQTAVHFRERMNLTRVKQVIYLSGIVNDSELSDHLRSRHRVEELLSAGKYALTVLRSGIIIGSGSASFEIIRDLVEKLPVMVAPRWLNTRSQPIGIRNVIEFLKSVMLDERVYGHHYDIGGPEVLTYRDILLRMAQAKGLKRKIVVVPVMTPRLSSYWLYFVTSTSYKLAVNLVNSMKVEVICRPNELAQWYGISLMTYDEALQLALANDEEEKVVSSWKDALNSPLKGKSMAELAEVPIKQAYSDRRCRYISDKAAVTDRIWSIGGKNGWYYANWLWVIRGFIDKLFGGVGLRRGRRNQNNLLAGDSLDFWRVVSAEIEIPRLLLYAEMKLPGEAWLEFRLEGKLLCQTATFRPRGWWGHLYWFSVYPFHAFIFGGMLTRIAKGKN